jgi:hypothetical protein
MGGGAGKKQHILRYEPCQFKTEIVADGKCVAPPNPVSVESMTDSDLLYNQ